MGGKEKRNEEHLEYPSNWRGKGTLCVLQLQDHRKTTKHEMTRASPYNK